MPTLVRRLKRIVLQKTRPINSSPQPQPQTQTATVIQNYSTAPPYHFFNKPLIVHQPEPLPRKVNAAFTNAAPSAAAADDTTSGNASTAAATASAYDATVTPNGTDTDGTAESLHVNEKTADAAKERKRKEFAFAMGEYPDFKRCPKSGKRACSADGCFNQVVQRGVCVKHGAQTKRCRIERCPNGAVQGGVCIKHGARRKPCRVEGCKNQPVQRGICVRHGAQLPRCNREGCSNQAIRGGLCIRHGANKVHNPSANL